MLTADNYAFHLVGLCLEECSAMTKRLLCFNSNFYISQVVDHVELANLVDLLSIRDTIVEISRPKNRVKDNHSEIVVTTARQPGKASLWRSVVEEYIRSHPEQDFKHLPSTFTNTTLKSGPGFGSEQSDDGVIDIDVEFSPFVDDTEIIEHMISEGLIDVASPEEITAGTSATQTISPAAVLEAMPGLAYAWPSPPEGILSRESVEAAIALATTAEADAGLPDNRTFNDALKEQAYKDRMIKIQNSSYSGAFANPLTREKYEAELKEPEVDISDITASVIKRFSR